MVPYDTSVKKCHPNFYLDPNPNYYPDPDSNFYPDPWSDVDFKSGPESIETHPTGTLVPTLVISFYPEYGTYGIFCVTLKSKLLGLFNQPQKKRETGSDQFCGPGSSK